MTDNAVTNNIDSVTVTVNSHEEVESADKRVYSFHLSQQELLSLSGLYRRLLQTTTGKTANLVSGSDSGLLLPSKYYKTVKTWHKIIVEEKTPQGWYPVSPSIFTDSDPDTEQLERFMLHLDLAMYLEDDRYFKCVISSLLRKWTVASTAVLARAEAQPDVKRAIWTHLPYHLVPESLRETPSFLADWLNNFRDGEVVEINGDSEICVIYTGFMTQAAFLYTNRGTNKGSKETDSEREILIRMLSLNKESDEYKPHSMMTICYDKTSYQHRQTNRFFETDFDGQPNPIIISEMWNADGSKFPCPVVSYP